MVHVFPVRLCVLDLAMWVKSGNKEARLSLTNPRDAKACQNCSNSTCLITTLYLTILVYLHSF